MIKKRSLSSLLLSSLVFSSVVLGLTACNSGDETFRKADDPQEAGREFIRASLDGNYNKARFYLFPDSTNQMMLQKWRKDFDQLDAESKSKYKGADILVINIRNVSDSVTSYTYANTYKKDTTTIKIVRVNGDWLVDLKEILNHKK